MTWLLSLLLVSAAQPVIPLSTDEGGGESHWEPDPDATGADTSFQVEHYDSEKPSTDIAIPNLLEARATGETPTTDIAIPAFVKAADAEETPATASAIAIPNLLEALIETAAGQDMGTHVGNPSLPGTPSEDEYPNPQKSPRGDSRDGLPNLDDVDPEVMFAKNRPCFNYGAFYCEQEGSTEVLVFDPLGDLSDDLLKQLTEVQQAQLGLNLLQGENQDEEAALNERILSLLHESNRDWQCHADCAEFLDPREAENDEFSEPDDFTFHPEFDYPKELMPLIPIFRKPVEVSSPQCYEDLTEEEWDEYADYRWNLDAINHERYWDTSSQEWVYTDDDNDPLLDQVIDKECVCCGLKPTVVFVIDTGIQPHDEFGARLLTSDSREFISNPEVQAVGDTHGHGTHVAGTVGGCTVGVNQCTHLISYRVFPTQSGSTSRSRIIRAINKATSERGEDQWTNHDMTINLSLGGSVHSDYDIAVNAAVDAGITVVIAAGNGNGLACNQGPANVGSAITVGSTTKSNTLSGFTNYGSCVDIQAPGSNVYSAGKLSAATPTYSYTESDQYTTMSGTSMASPAVAGMASLVQAYREKLGVDFQDPAEVWEYIRCVAREDFITGMGVGTTKGPPNPNLFLQRYLVKNWKPFCYGWWWYAPFLVDRLKDIDDYTPLQEQLLKEEAANVLNNEEACRHHDHSCTKCKQTDGCDLFIIEGRWECHNEEYLIAQGPQDAELGDILRVETCDVAEFGNSLAEPLQQEVLRHHVEGQRSYPDSKAEELGRI